MEEGDATQKTGVSETHETLSFFYSVDRSHCSGFASTRVDSLCIKNRQLLMTDTVRLSTHKSSHAPSKKRYGES